MREELHRKYHGDLISVIQLHGWHVAKLLRSCAGGIRLVRGLCGVHVGKTAAGGAAAMSENE